MNTKETVTYELENSQLPKLLSIVASLMFELTIVGRECYGELGKSSDRLRAVNETMHRLSGVMIDLLEGDASSVSPIIINAFFSDRADATLGVIFSLCFDRAWSKIESG